MSTMPQLVHGAAFVTKFTPGRSERIAAPAKSRAPAIQFGVAADCGAPGFAKEAPPSGRAARPRGKLQSVQVMRGLAAAAVALFHTPVILSEPKYGAMVMPSGLVDKGWIGVNLFFVLSGFIILRAHIADIDAPARLPNYFWRRFARVYPLYWAFLAVFVVTALAGIGREDFSHDALGIISTLSLVKFSPGLVLPLKVAWTLFHEVMFYAIFALLILNRRLGIVVMTAWFAVILAHIGSANIWLAPSSIWNINFFFGMAAGLLYTRLGMKTGFGLLAAGLSVLALLLCSGAILSAPDQQEHAPIAFIALGVAFAMVVLGAAVVERASRSALPRLALLLGDASYSVYLVHSAVISILCIVGARWHYFGASPLVAFGAIGAAAIGSGVVAHVVLEKPLLKALRRPARVPAAAITGPVSERGAVPRAAFAGWAGLWRPVVLGR